ncbi:MAG TPA: substrate-binding domain-containing protein [Candidatus Stackebrandtia excrementipullorum]|nr:substrate-binding domain-containing protein [Candidatus Stackebrandtia excrementipullorum]
MTYRAKWVVGAVAAVTALGLSGCGGVEDAADGLSGEVVIDGSSTVEPLSAAAAELFQSEHGGVNVTVGTSGTGGGFKKFCVGETDISDASRPIKDEEIAVCDENEIAYTPLQVANDALTVVVHPDNTWADCLTVDQLKTIWEPDGASADDQAQQEATHHASPNRTPQDDNSSTDRAGGVE